MRRVLAAVASLAFWATGAARADGMYRWLDAAGGVHYGSEPPADARSVAPWSPDAGRLKIESAPASSPPATHPAEPPTRAGAQPPAAQPDKLGGRTETGWRREVRQLEERIADCERKLEDFDDSTHAYGGWATHRDGDRVEQIDLPDERAQLERDLQQARAQLEQLEEEARRSGVPPGWLR